MVAIAGIAFAAAAVLAVALQYPKAAALAPLGEVVRGDLVDARGRSALNRSGCRRSGVVNWSRLSVQKFRVDKWSLCRG